MNDETGWPTLPPPTYTAGVSCLNGGTGCPTARCGPRCVAWRPASTSSATSSLGDRDRTGASHEWLVNTSSPTRNSRWARATHDPTGPEPSLSDSVGAGGTDRVYPALRRKPNPRPIKPAPSKPIVPGTGTSIDAMP